MGLMTFKCPKKETEQKVRVYLQPTVGVILVLLLREQITTFLRVYHLQKGCDFWCGFGAVSGVVYRHLKFIKFINPINLGAKIKVLTSSFRNCPWI